MSHLITSITIAQAIDHIKAGRILITALRPFAYFDEGQILALFDSLMLGYPIGSMQFWNCETPANYPMMSLPDSYHEFNNTNNSSLVTTNETPVFAILDGQVRLAALYVSLCGMVASRTHCQSTPKDFEGLDASEPTERLYLNLSYGAAITELKHNLKHDFRFVADAPPDIFRDEHQQLFVRVGYVLELHRSNQPLSNQNSLTTQETIVYNRLLDALTQDLCINYYVLPTQDIDQIAHVLCRITNHDRGLSQSEIILAMLDFFWQRHKPKIAINALVARLSKKHRSRISLDDVFQIFLMLHDEEIIPKVSLFNQSFSTELESKWPVSCTAIEKAYLLVASFNLASLQSTTASVMAPIVYYLYHTGKYASINTLDQADLDTIRQYLQTHGRGNLSGDQLLAARVRLGGGGELGFYDLDMGLNLTKA